MGISTLFRLIARLCYVCVLLAATAAIGSERGLPQDLEDIIRANSDSLRQMRSCIATLEHSRWQETADHGLLSYKNIFSVWSDGRRVREDFVADPNDSGEQRKIVIREDSDGGQFILGPPDAFRQILTPEVEYSYRPGATAMATTKGDISAPYGRRASMLHRYAVVLGHTLEEKVRQNAEQGYLPLISEVVLEGVQSKLLEWEYPEAKMAMKIWVVPSKGHMIKKLQVFHKGGAVKEWSAQIKEYGDGVFWFERVEVKELLKGSLAKRTTVQVKTLDVNAPVDKELFTLEGMDIPPGTEIQDRIVGLRLRYGSPFALPEEYIESAIMDALTVEEESGQIKDTIALAQSKETEAFTAPSKTATEPRSIEIKNERASKAQGVLASWSRTILVVGSAIVLVIILSIALFRRAHRTNEGRQS